MRSIAIATILLLGATGAAVGQALPSGSIMGGGGGDLAVTYHWVRTNTLGGCGCFGLNGGGVSGSWRFRPALSAVAEASVEHTANGPTGGSLTLTTYMAGARYVILPLTKERTRGIQVFAQLLAGGGHAGGGIAGPGDSTSAFVGRLGGGIDYPVNPRIAVRFQSDYFLSNFQNTGNNHQNNMLFGGGITYLWSRGGER